jgi:hypothetical protein
VPAPGGTLDIQAAVLVLAGMGAIQFTIGNYIDPRLEGRPLAISPLVVVVSIFGWALVWGVPGAFIGVPMMIGLITFCEPFERTRWIAHLLGSRRHLPATVPPVEDGEASRRGPLPRGSRREGRHLNQTTWSHHTDGLKRSRAAWSGHGPSEKPSSQWAGRAGLSGSSRDGRARPPRPLRAGHDKHAGHSVEMFGDRFWVCLALTVPTLVWEPMLQDWFGYRAPTFPGSSFIPAIFGAIVFFYGGWVFLHSAARELADRLPGMMTLIALAISVAFLYSAAVTLGFEGHALWWELATLVTIMLLGHWIEMRCFSSNSRSMKPRTCPRTASSSGSNPSPPKSTAGVVVAAWLVSPSRHDRDQGVCRGSGRRRFRLRSNQGGGG